MKRALVVGAGGFIGGHLCRKLHKEGYRVHGVDIKAPEFCPKEGLGCEKFFTMDMAIPYNWTFIFQMHKYDEIYQLAADMGGAGFIFTGEHDVEVMINSARINITLCKTLTENRELIPDLKVFYSSSACVYPQENQKDNEFPHTAEHSAYPANPDSEYGWEKLFSERLYFAMNRNYGLNIRVCRFHNVFGPYGTYTGGREKAPAALCRKIASLPPEGGTIDIWGDGEQTRSFIYIDEALEAIRRFMNANFHGPLNIGSSEMVTINELVGMITLISGKNVNLHHIGGPIGVRGRNSDNRLIQEKLGWAPSRPLFAGLQKTYKWIEECINAEKTKEK
ncbi:MAG: NAD-dependent epimerase/dehydratase family protein [Bacteroidales bacterium]